jgi:hypothetical protein
MRLVWDRCGTRSAALAIRFSDGPRLRRGGKHRRGSGILGHFKASPRPFCFESAAVGGQYRRHKNTVAIPQLRLSPTD